MNRSPYMDSLKTNISSMTKEECQAGWASNQAFIALGLGVAAAAELRISSCPMGGFVAADVHKVMQLPDNQWPVDWIIAIGSSLDLPERIERIEIEDFCSV
jgi:nitroreductase/dihydropteridine reductase